MELCSFKYIYRERERERERESFVSIAVLRIRAFPEFVALN